VTFRAAVEGTGIDNNAYAMVYLYGNGSIRIDGYGQQKSYDLAAQ